MAILKPNEKYTMCGVTVNEKIIPDGTRWKDATKARNAGFSAGSLYKKQAKLSGGTGKAKTVTVHNTNDLENVHDDGEQYTRATYNENMGSARVHFYVDDVGAWQNLKAGTGLCSADPVGSAEVGFHAGDGSVSDGGNMTSLSIEIIMDDTAEHDAKARDNGARVAAWLLWKHGLPIGALVTHTYWVNKSAGSKFTDVDEQCCNRVSGKKWCPAYIFGSNNESTALNNWKAFKALVKKYLDELNGVNTGASTSQKAEIKATDAAASFDKSVAGTYKVTASALNVRHGAGAEKGNDGKDKHPVMVAIPKDTAVRCYGYYTAVNGVKWLYVQFAYQGVTYTGFASGKYLKK